MRDIRSIDPDHDKIENWLATGNSCAGPQMETGDTTVRGRGDPDEISPLRPDRKQRRATANRIAG